jgi:hypothetical protein
MTLVQTKTSLLARLCTSLVCIPLLCLGGVVVAAGRGSEENDSQARAKLIWEQAVEAKGGRARLYSINNAVVVSRGVIRFNLFRRSPILLEYLLVFPNKLWSWNDMRPSVFGLTINMYNYDSGQHFTWPPLIFPKEEILTKPPEGGSLMYSFLPFLPETKWLQPVPVAATTGKSGFRKIDIVQTTVNGNRVDFAFDQKTHLARRITYYSVVRGKTYDTTIQLSDYGEVNGIKVPRVFKYDEDGSVYKEDVQFNIEYDPDVFTKRPSPTLGSKAWMKR